MNSIPKAPGGQGGPRARAGGPPARPAEKPQLLDHPDSARVVVGAAQTRTFPDPIVVASLPPEWAEALGVVVTQGVAGFDPWLRTEKKRLKNEPERFEAIKAALERALAEPPPDVQILPIQPCQERPPRFRLIRMRELAEAEYRTTWLVEGALVADQPCIVAAPKKALKTSTMADLAFACATATPWLGRFRVPEPTTVLFMSGESGEATLQDTMRRVAAARGMDVLDAEERLVLSHELPKLGDPADVLELQEIIRREGIRVVVIDPLYLCLLSGAGGKQLDPANLFDVGPLLLQVSRACLDAGATPVLVHHFRKSNGTPYELPELESIAYAGTQEFARQWILLGRRRRYEPGTSKHELWLSVGGSAGHSGEYAVDVDEGVMDADFGGRRWEVSVRYASEANRDADHVSDLAKAERAIAANVNREAAKEKAVAADAEKAFAKLEKIGPATRADLRDHLGWNSAKLGAALAKLLEAGRIEGCTVTVKTGTGTRTTQGVQVASGGGLLNPD